MSRKNRPDKKTLVPVIPQPPEQPVMHGNVFATFVQEAGRIGQEVEARRGFDHDVGVYLKEKGLVDEFNAWQTARRSPPSTK